MAKHAHTLDRGKMTYGDPISDLASAMHSALLVDLPEVEYLYKSPEDYKTGKMGTKKKRRPRKDEITIYHFQQTWGDTSLGFGGVGGQSLTSAYTTVVIDHRCGCVYFAGMLAYKVPNITSKFMADVHACDMAGKWAASKYTE